MPHPSGVNLLERLDAVAAMRGSVPNGLLREAADAIRRLQQENALLTRSLMLLTHPKDEA